MSFSTEPLLRPAEVARALGVSRSWLYDAAKSGRIPSVRIGGPDGPVRFVPADLERWLAGERAAWTPGRGEAHGPLAAAADPAQGKAA